MLFKVINNDKVKVLVEANELNGFKPSNLDKDDETSRNTIAKLLIDIYNQTGVNFLDSKIVVEVLSGVSKTYYLIITRVTESEKNLSLNSNNDGVDMYLFRLEGPEKTIDIANEFKKCENIKLNNSELHKYNGQYFLSLYFSADSVNSDEFDDFIVNLARCANRCKWSILNESILHEWGQLICKNVIEKINSVAVE